MIFFSFGGILFLFGGTVFVFAFCKNFVVVVQIFIQGMSREGSLSWNLEHTPWEDALPWVSSLFSGPHIHMFFLSFRTEESG